MAVFSEELQRWATEMKETWDGLAKDVRNIVGEEKVKVFEVKLDDLLDLLKDNQHLKRDNFEIYKHAEEVYDMWCAFSKKGKRAEKGGVPIGGHVLPPLPYPYNALEPYISAEIMELHHKVHHKDYVEGLNKAEKKLQEARQKGNFELIKHWSREAAFHGAGHYLHTIFWNIMSPRGGGEPRGELAEQIKRNFGSFTKFKEHFSKAAENVEGVGWSLLVWSPRSHRLEILQAEKHQNLSQQDIVPILVLDVWEHAYYLQYKTERAEYIKNWWNIVNWNHANKRFKLAKNLRWSPY